MIAPITGMVCLFVGLIAGWLARGDMNKAYERWRKRALGSRNFHRHLVDVVWQTSKESEEVPSTKWADEMIAAAHATYEPCPLGDDGNHIYDPEGVCMECNHHER